jgi:demethylspheroidene O-methyltransferase
MSMLNDIRRRWAGLSNRMIGSARVRRVAAALPPARPVARHYAADLFDLTAGFVYTQITAAMVESGLLAALRERPLSSEEASTCASLAPPATATLLKAAASLGLVQAIGNRWMLGQRGAALLASPGLTELIAHHKLLYRDLADPLAMLRGGGGGHLAGLWQYGAGADPQAIAAYSKLMAASQPMVAEQALAAYRFGRHRRMIDLGGGEGAFVAAVARAAPRLRLGLFDLPAVVDRARERLTAEGLIDRVQLHGGSLHSGPLPTGYDLATLVRVLHDHDDGPVAGILAAAHAALAPGGRLLIVEPMAGDGPPGHAYFGFYLAALGSGRPRTPVELKRMALESGFRRVCMLGTPLPLVARVLLGEKS